MLIEEHVQTAMDFLDAADREFDDWRRASGFGETMGSRLPRSDGCGDTSGLEFGKPSRIERSRQQVGHVEYEDEFFARLRFGSLAEKFHINFYHGAMEPFEINVGPPSC